MRWSAAMLAFALLLAAALGVVVLRAEQVVVRHGLEQRMIRIKALRVERDRLRLELERTLDDAELRRRWQTLLASWLDSELGR